MVCGDTARYERMIGIRKYENERGRRRLGGHAPPEAEGVNSLQCS